MIKMRDKAIATLDKEYIRDRKYNSRPEWVITLAAQILTQVIKDLQRKNKTNISAKNKEDAQQWLNSDEDKYMFDFVNICQLFNIDTQLTRIKIFGGTKLPNLNLCPKTRKQGRRKINV